jgi:hypothetical protein
LFVGNDRTKQTYTCWVTRKKKKRKVGHSRYHDLEQTGAEGEVREPPLLMLALLSGLRKPPPPPSSSCACDADTPTTECDGNMEHINTETNQFLTEMLIETLREEMGDRSWLYR